MKKSEILALIGLGSPFSHYAGPKHLKSFTEKVEIECCHKAASCPKGGPEGCSK